MLAGGVDGRQQPRPERRRSAATSQRGIAADERIERAGLGQALEHALVDEPQVEILAERVRAT